MLSLRDINISYGPVKAVKGASLKCQPGCITALIGANGAGKSSLMKAISGVVATNGGNVFLNGEDISVMPAYWRAQNGIAHALEGRRLYHQLSVEDNLKTAWLFRRPQGSFNDALNEVYINFPILKEKRHLKAGTLSGGQQQMLIISMATLHKPTVVMLDEPSLGLAPIIVTQIFEFIRSYCQDGTRTILLSEQMATLALRVADYGYVLKHGEVVLEGDRATLKEMMRGELTTAYLGGSK